MNIGDLFRVLGGATVAGLGTAEEQRQRQDKATQMAMTYDIANRAKQQAAIQHMQDLLERAAYHKGVLDYQQQRLASAPGLINVDPRTGENIGETRPGQAAMRIPGTEAIYSPPVDVSGPDTTGAVAPTIQTPAISGRPAIPMQANVYASWLTHRNQMLEKASKAEKANALQRAADLYSQGSSLEEAHRQSGAAALGLHTQDWLGYVPAAPGKEEAEALVDTGEGGYATKADVLQRIKTGQAVTSAGSAARKEAQASREEAAKEREQTNIDRQLSTWANNYRNEMESVYGALGSFAGVPPIPEAWYNALKMPDRVYEAKYGTKQRPDKKQMALMRAQQLGQFFKKGQVAQGTLRKQDQGRIEQILQMEGLPLE
jgi:hypothetical protein